jgi:hypothetical protein
MLTGAVHKTGTPRGTSFFFFCFASTEENDTANSKTAKTTDLLQTLFLNISTFPFDTCDLQNVWQTTGKVRDKGAAITADDNDLIGHASYSQVVVTANKDRVSGPT